MQLELERMRASGIPVGEDEYRGLYVSDAEADRLAAAAPTDGDPLAPVRARLEQLTASATGPLGRLVQLAQLEPFDVGVLLLCLASEADLGIERLISYVQDDVSKRRPRVELALRLLAPPGQRRAARDRFHAAQPLRRLRLVTLHDEPGQPSTPLAARYIALDSRIAAHLLGSRELDEHLQVHGRLRPADGDSPGRESLAELGKLAAGGLRPPVVALKGIDDDLVLASAETLAAAAGLSLIDIAFGQLVQEEPPEVAITVALREGALLDAAVLLRGLDGLSAEARRHLFGRLETEPLAPLVLLASHEGSAWPGIEVSVEAPDFDGRLERWRAGLAGEAVSGEELQSLAGKFRLRTRGIADGLRAARGRAQLRDPHQPRITIDDLYAAAREQSAPILSDLAKKVTPHYSWTDLILPEDAAEQLREMCAFVEHRHQVYDSWGFDRRLAMGKGLMALFAGQSGTGKTMAADVLAGHLGLDLYKIDLSGVVSKYIGETEKNLGNIFREAESSNAILFFDEADALFGKRSEVKDAHDRYANVETAYLLQRMEEYSGMVILATNLKMNLDEAFLRRMHFVIDFPMPEEDDRRRIWERTISPEAPLDDDVDFAFLARQFRIAGGNIRNIVLAAAFLAASDGTSIGMRHFIRATRREYQKLGRMVTDAEFGEYVALVRPESRPGRG